MDDKESTEALAETLKPYEDRVRRIESENRWLAEENRRLAEENRRLKIKACGQRRKRISQKRREAVNIRWKRYRATQNATAGTMRKNASVTARNVLRKTYKPTEMQVRAFMMNDLNLREDVAEEEAKNFLEYNDARGWNVGGAPMVDWNACVRRWVKKLEEHTPKFMLYEERQEERKQEEEARRQAEERKQEEEARRQAEERKQEDEERRKRDLQQAEARRQEEARGRAEKAREIMYFSNYFVNGTGIGGKRADEIMEAMKAIEEGNFPNDQTGRVAWEILNRIKAEGKTLAACVKSAGEKVKTEKRAKPQALAACVKSAGEKVKTEKQRVAEETQNPLVAIYACMIMNNIFNGERGPEALKIKTMIENDDFSNELGIVAQAVKTRISQAGTGAA